jgi:hypothetical protein
MKISAPNMTFRRDLSGWRLVPWNVSLQRLANVDAKAERSTPKRRRMRLHDRCICRILCVKSLKLWQVVGDFVFLLLCCCFNLWE